MGALGSFRRKIAKQQVLADARDRVKEAKKNDPKLNMLDRATRRSVFSGLLKRMAAGLRS